MASIYNEMQQTSKTLGERNDCVVKALAASTGKSYEEVHRVCKIAGRRKGHGMVIAHWVPLFMELGKSYIEYRPRKENGGQYTMKTIASVLDPKKNYVAVVKGHAAAVVNGVVEDWPVGRRHRVNWLYEVTSKGAPVTARNSKFVPHKAKTKPRTKGACAVVWDICNRNPNATRQAIIAKCVAKGVHPGTASTQYGKWKNAE